MGNSTIKLVDVCDVLAGKNIPDPRRQPSGYGDKLAMQMASDVMADIVTERFNWKWNSHVAVPFYTNSWQQDYPQLAQPDGAIGWGENLIVVDINNTQVPKPLWTDPQVTWRRALPATTVSAWRVAAVCWMYNRDMQLGMWPGPNVTYAPLVTGAPQQQNPLMSMVDVNGNILIVNLPPTEGGITGGTAPELPANSAEGETVTDGTVQWVCVSPTSQGFRLNFLPSAAGPCFQITPTYQADALKMVNYQQTLDPIPDSFSRHYFRCLELQWKIAAGKATQLDYETEINALATIMKQGDKETNVYQLLPATSPVERLPWNYSRRSATDPY